MFLEEMENSGLKIIGGLTNLKQSLPGNTDSRESACNAGGQAQSLGWGDSLEKEMAAQSSILAWKIP